MTDAKPISAAVLMAFFNGTDAQQTGAKVAELEGSRLNYLLKHFERSELSDVKDAIKGMKAQADAEAKGDKKAPVYRSAQTRAGEVQAMFGAFTFADWKPKGIGYQKAVEQARQVLNEKGIRWDGTVKPDQIAREVRKEARTTAAVFEQVELAKRRAEAAGKELTAEEVEEQRQRALDASVKQGARQMAATIYKRKGVDFSSWLIESLEALIAEGEKQAEGEEAPSKQQAAA